MAEYVSRLLPLSSKWKTDKIMDYICNSEPCPTIPTAELRQKATTATNCVCAAHSVRLSFSLFECDFFLNFFSSSSSLHLFGFGLYSSL